jgi:excisionase family DNA binding protein
VDAGFITFNSIIYDELMPWLPENADPEKFRQLMRISGLINIAKINLFFNCIPLAFSEMGITNKGILLKEWESFSELPVNGQQDDFFSLLLAEKENPRVDFYFLLTAVGTASYWALISTEVKRSCSKQYRKYFVMNTIKTLGDMIRFCRPPATADRDSFRITDRVKIALILLYLELWAREKAVIDIAKLPLTRGELKEMIMNIKKADPSSEPLIQIIAQRYLSDTNNMGGTKPLPETATGVISNAPSSPPASQPGSEQDSLNQDGFSQLMGIWGAGNIRMESIQDQEVNDEKKSQEDNNGRVGCYEACKLLGVSKNTLMMMRRRKEIGFTMIGKRYQYSSSEIDNIVKINTRNT